MVSLLQPADPRRLTEREVHAFALGYIHLLGARCRALDEGLPPAAAAVPLEAFLCSGLGLEHLLWMLYQKHADHYQAVPDDDGCPRLQLVQTLLLGPDSALAVTDLGWQFGGDFLGDLCERNARGKPAPTCDAVALGRLVPRYERHDRLFCWGGYVLKQFRQPATNQVLVLLTAEELHWPRWFDDPLWRRPATNSKKRLHDTLQDLNRRQQAQLIHFKGDGSGNRIGWDYC
jgi:hypothetical protein